MDPRRLLLPLTVLACLSIALTLLLGMGKGLSGDARAEGGEELVASAPGGATPRTVLADWDARRARAWSDGDVAGLRALYVTGSRAGKADTSLLRDYVDRGLVVTGLQTQVLGLHVRHHSSDRLALVVTDRIVGGAAVGDGGERRLPTDRPSTRRITMRKVAGEWLVVEVRDHESAAASTSETSSSSKS